jgi:hypothetical protein
MDDDLEFVSVWRLKRNKYERNETEANALYQSCREVWLDSQVFLSLKAQLDALTVPMNKIVCFGLRTMAYPDECNSVTQQAAVKSLIDYLKERTGGHIYFYAQDPAYLDSDKEFLQTLGIDTIENPKGFFEVDERTLVISLHPSVPVRQIISDMKWSAAMIWDTIQSIEWYKALWGGVMDDHRQEKTDG